MTRRSLLAAVAIVALVATGCSSDSDEDDASATEVTVGIPSVPSDDSSSASTPSTDASDDSQSLTGEQICARLTPASMSADLGLDVLAAEPDDSATPQCAYLYQTDGGGTSNVTVAAMRPVDVGGASGAEAFDMVVRINETMAGDDAETQQLDAGEQAIRITGASLHLGVVQIGDAVYTLIVPVGDAGADDVDHLIGTAATALRGG